MKGREAGGEHRQDEKQEKIFQLSSQLWFLLRLVGQKGLVGTDWRGWRRRK